MPDERLVITERVASGGTLLSVSLMTAEFTPVGPNTRLVLTHQIVALDGAGIVEGSQAGWTEVLENLAHELMAGGGSSNEGDQRR